TDSRRPVRPGRPGPADRDARDPVRSGSIRSDPVRSGPVGSGSGPRTDAAAVSGCVDAHLSPVAILPPAGTRPAARGPPTPTPVRTPTPNPEPEALGRAG